MITVSSKGEVSMVMVLKVDGEDTISSRDTPSNNPGTPVRVVSSCIYMYTSAVQHVRHSVI